MYVNFPNLVLNTGLIFLRSKEVRSILIDRDRQELSKLNTKGLLPFLSTLSMKEFVHRMLFDCTTF